MWHFFAWSWTHHHYLSDLIGWLRHLYPGMEGHWYSQYAGYLVHTYGTGRDLLTAVEP